MADEESVELQDIGASSLDESHHMSGDEGDGDDVVSSEEPANIYGEQPALLAVKNVRESDNVDPWQSHSENECFNVIKVSHRRLVHGLSHDILHYLCSVGMLSTEVDYPRIVAMEKRFGLEAQNELLLSIVYNGGKKSFVKLFQALLASESPKSQQLAKEATERLMNGETEDKTTLLDIDIAQEGMSSSWALGSLVL